MKNSQKTQTKNVLRMKSLEILFFIFFLISSVTLWAQVPGGMPNTNLASSATASSIIIDLVEFKATPIPEGGGIGIEWTVEDPSFGDIYTIERAGSDGNFISIGIADGVYEYIDETPLNGENHYRLSQETADGITIYSEVLSTIHEIDMDLKLSPNPASNFLQVHYKVEKHAAISVQLLDQFGNLVIAVNPDTSAGGHRHTSLDVSNYNHGLYFIRLVDAAGSQTKKFFIQ